VKWDIDELFHPSPIKDDGKEIDWRSILTILREVIGRRNRVNVCIFVNNYFIETQKEIKNETRI
jgi:hypothetical protein